MARWGWVWLGLAGCVTDAEVRRILDRDGDGFRTVEAGGSDCDDADASVFPGAVEVCDDARDNDCDGSVDDFGEGAVRWFRDDDGDGFGSDDFSLEACVEWPEAAGWSQTGGDCDDAVATTYPGALEACDGVDNDCSSVVDDGAGVASTPGALHSTFGDAVEVALSEGGPVGLCAGEIVVTTPPRVAAGQRLELVGRGAQRTTLRGDGVATVVLVDGGELVVAGATLVGPATLDATAIRALGSSRLTVTDCVLRDTASGVQIDGAVEATFTATSFLGNGAGDPDEGGLVARDGASITIRGGRFANNRGDRGGALSLDAAIVTVDGTEILDNDATRGAGLYAESGASVTLTAVTLTDNAAEVEGGAIYVDGATVTVGAGSVVHRNVAGVRSGAAHVANGVLVLDEADFGVGANDNLPQDLQSDDGVEDEALGTRVTATCDRFGC